MKRKKILSGMSLALTAAMVIGSVSAASPIQAAAREKAAGTTYYIDAQSGDDANAGTSESAAWASLEKTADLALKAGDRVLLKAGSSWNGQKLMIENAKGEEGNPVIIGKYGDADKSPVINGNGNPWNDGTDVGSLNKEDVAAVHIKNSSYITIQDLEVSNWENDEADLMSDEIPQGGNRQSKSMLTGILVENCDAGNIPGVVIQNNYVHNVNGYMSQNGSEGHKKGSGGIMALVTSDDRTTKSYFTDLKILGNKVDNVCHEAIYMESCWAARNLVGGGSSQQAGTLEWVGWPNVYVADNWVDNVAGDGIVLINADGGVAEHNLITRSARETWNFKRNPAHAAIWMWDCNNVTMQYNEAGHTESTQDGMAFDCDYGNQNMLYQYNYSHDNKGGFWMACPGPYYSVNAVIRYNVSVNDGATTRIMHVGEQGSVNHQVYNNTIYWDYSNAANVVEQGGWTDGVFGKVKAVTSGTDFYNNIIYGKSGTFVKNDGIKYDNNCVYGGVQEAYQNSAQDENAVIADPKFVNPEDISEGAFANGKVTLGQADGLKLQADSPCINAGRSHMPTPVAVPKDGFFDKVIEELVDTHIEPASGDYAGRAVYPFVAGKVDIGAFEGSADELGEITVDKAYLSALVAQGERYQADQFVASSWKNFAPVLADTKKALERNDIPQEMTDTYALRLEKAMGALQPFGSSRPGTPEDDVFAQYNASATKDNSGFEKSESDWGLWQASREISTEQKHSGAQSLKITKDSDADTGYSEIGGVPVELSTKYICEAWFYCDDASKVGLEAKHHNSYTVSKQDVKLGSAAAQDVEGSDWKKVHFEFTTGDSSVTSQAKISIAAYTELGTVYMDDVVLYPEMVVAKEDVDRTALEEALAVVPDKQEANCTPASWKKYKDAVIAARLKCADALATQEEISQAVQDLNAALSALTAKGNKFVLNATYETYKNETQGNYSAASWANFQNKLNEAKAVLDSEDSSQKQVDDALAALLAARNALTVEKPNPPSAEKKEQKISVKTAIKKKYGDKAFSLNAKLTEGNGKLSYVSSDRKVATVSEAGKVTIKGTGFTKITVTAAATEAYHEKKAEVTLKVSPKKMTLKSIKAAKGKKLTLKWTKDKTASGYEIQYAIKSNFKSAKKTSVKKGSATSATLKKLSKGKRYYVKIRAYKNIKIDGKNEVLRGDWSKPKKSPKVK